MDNCKIEGCNNVVENKDLQLCSSHNRAMRKAETNAAKPKKFHTINKVSDKKKIAIREKHKTYNKMDATTPKVCSGCGRSGVLLSHSHIIPVSQHQEFEATLENLVYDCLTPNPDMPGGHCCHDLWEHGSWEDVKHLNNFQHRINVITKLCPAYLNKIL